MVVAKTKVGILWPSQIQIVVPVDFPNHDQKYMSTMADGPHM